MKDLFRVVFDALSDFDYDTFAAEFLERAPFRMLHAAASVHEELASIGGFRELYDCLNETSARHRRNPELYPHLSKLLGGSTGPEAATSLLALRTHVELVPVSPEAFGEHPYLRLRAGAPRTVRRDGGALREISATVTIDAAAARFPVVYLPVPHLFDDIVGAQTYVGEGAPMDPAPVARQIAGAVAELRAYCPALCDGFLDTIGTIGVTGERGTKTRRSYSTETFYSGGIFVTLGDDNVPSLVESFIHEYYHQRLWLWWLIEPPDDLPPETLTIVSPVTNTERSALVMLHALLIYVSASDYYRDAIRRGVTGGGWCADRLAHLERGTRRLIAELEAVLADRPASLRFVRLAARAAA